MNCPKCHSDVAANHAFCMKCGTRVIAGPATANASATTPGRTMAAADSLTFPEGAAKTLPVDLEMLRAAVSASETPDDLSSSKTSPVDGPALELQQLRPPRAGSRVALVGRVRWTAAAGVRPLLEMECPALNRSEGIQFQAGDWATFTFDLHPQQPGAYRVCFRLERADADDHVGEYLLQVDPESEAAPVIQIHNQQTNDARIAVGQEAHINVHVAGREEGTWRDAPAWIPIPLHVEGAAPVAAVFSGVKRPWKPYVPGRNVVSRLSLRIRRGNSTRNICLISGTRLRIGKQRGQNDVVLRIVPTDAAFERLWGRVSRRHAEIHLTSNGAEWRNADCGNGTVVDGGLLPANQSIPVRQNHLFRPAGVAELELQCTLIPGAPTDANASAYEQFSRKLGSVPHDWEPIGPYAGLRLNRVNNCGHLEEYLLLQRGCSVGSDPGSGLVIPDASVCLSHAALFVNHHGVWLEPIQQQYATCVDGQQVPPHRLVQLLPGMSPLQLGEVQIGVTDFQQWYVDVAPTEYR